MWQQKDKTEYRPEYKPFTLHILFCQGKKGRTPPPQERYEDDHDDGDDDDDDDDDDDESD